MIRRAIKANTDKELHKNKFFDFSVADSLFCTMTVNALRKMSSETIPCLKIKKILYFGRQASTLCMNTSFEKEKGRQSNLNESEM